LPKPTQRKNPPKVPNQKIETKLGPPGVGLERGEHLGGASAPTNASNKTSTPENITKASPGGDVGGILLATGEKIDYRSYLL